MQVTKEDEQRAIEIAPTVIQILTSRDHRQNWYCLDPLYTALKRRLRRDPMWRHGPLSVLDSGGRAYKNLSKFTSIEGKHVLDLGCGFYNPLGVSLFFYLNGASACTAIDVQDSDRTRAAEALGELLLDSLADDSDLTVAQLPQVERFKKISCFNINALNSGDLESGISNAPINYSINSSHTMESIEDNSIDIVSSHAVFEHIPDVETTFKTLNRKMTSGGVAHLVIDMVDHRFYENSEKYNHFSWLSELDQEPDDHVCNRLRAPDFLRLISSSGFSVLSEKRSYAEVPETVKSSLKPEYQALSEEDLRTTFLELIISK